MNDKVLHLLAGIIIYSSYVVGGTNMIYAGCVTVLVAIAKELYDKYWAKTSFDSSDAICTALGGLAAAIVDSIIRYGL